MAGSNRKVGRTSDDYTTGESESPARNNIPLVVLGFGRRYIAFSSLLGPRYRNSTSMLLGNGWQSVCRSCFLLLLLASLSWSAREAIAQIKSRVMPSAGGGTAFRPERWGIIQLAFVNLDDQPVELMATSFFDNDPALQF